MQLSGSPPSLPKHTLSPPCSRSRKSLLAVWLRSPKRSASATGPHTEPPHACAPQLPPVLASGAGGGASEPAGRISPSSHPFWVLSLCGLARQASAGSRNEPARR